MLLAAVAGNADDGTYWIADERPYAMNEIVATIRRVLENEFGMTCAVRQMRMPALAGEAARVIDGSLQALGIYRQKIHVLGELTHSIACSIDKAKRELGYVSSFALYDGMRELVRWCLAHGLEL